MSLFVVPFNWTGAYHYARGDYALCIMSALTGNLLGAGYAMDVCLWLAPSKRAVEAVREAVFFLALVLTPAALRYRLGGEESAYGAVLLLLSGRAPFPACLLLALALEYVPTQLVVGAWLVWRSWTWGLLAAAALMYVRVPCGAGFYLLSSLFDPHVPPRWLARAAIGAAVLSRIATTTLK